MPSLYSFCCDSYLCLFANFAFSFQVSTITIILKLKNDQFELNNIFLYITLEFVIRRLFVWFGSEPIWLNLSLKLRAF